MPAPPADVVIPKSYKNVGFKHTKISHYPEDAPEATPIVIFTLYRPGKHNAFTETMMDEVEQAFQWFDLDDRVKCVITTGDGRIFCAGADLETSFKGGYEKPSDHRDGYVRSSMIDELDPNAPSERYANRQSVAAAAPSPFTAAASPPSLPCRAPPSVSVSP